MATHLFGIIALVALLGGVALFWNPKICQPINSALPNLNFDFCDFQSLRPKERDSSDAIVSTVVSSPQHKAHSDTRHQHLVTHNNTAIHAIRKKNASAHKAPNAHPLAPATHSVKCSGACLTVQCEGCPPPVTKANLVTMSDFKMSI